MKKFFQYFGFNRMEQYGFIVFMGIVFLILLIPYFFKFLSMSEDISYNLIYFEDSQENNDGVTMFELSKNRYTNASEKSNIEDRKISYFNFDPNGLDVSSWARLGLSDKQIKVIKNYEAKGGRFYKKEDVAKMYVISERDYKRLEPYIKIADNRHVREDNKSISEAKFENRSLLKSDIRVNINTADTVEWKLLKGIGSAFANRIVKYREALGGFSSADQVAEVYGLPQETMESIKPNLYLDQNTSVRRLNINSISVENLTKHPYINKKQAQVIVNYRTQHGDFKNLESLTQIKSLDSVFLRKIGDYLEF